MTAERRPTAPFAWIAALAFASGFPFGLINEALPVYLRTGGANLVDVGLVTAATFPWTFKFLWAPILDRTGTRKQWIAACLILLAIVIPLIARVDAAQHAQLFFVLIVLAVTLSATQDVAIDAFTIQATPRAAARAGQLGAHRRVSRGDARVRRRADLACRPAGLAGGVHGGDGGHGAAGGRGTVHSVGRTGAPARRPVHLAAAARPAHPPGRGLGARLRAALQARRRRDGPDDAAVLGRSWIVTGGDRRGTHHRTHARDGERRGAGWLPHHAMGHAHGALVAGIAAGRVEPRLLGGGGPAGRRRSSSSRRRSSRTSRAEWVRRRSWRT